MKTKLDFTNTDQPMGERFANLASEVNGRAQVLDHLLKNLGAYLSQLEAEVDGNPAAERYLEQCEKEMGKAETVVSEVAKIRRMDVLESTRLDLKDLVREICDREGKIRDVSIETDFDDQRDYLIKGVREQLVEAVMHLIHNIPGDTSSFKMKIEEVRLDANCVTLARSGLPHKNYWALSISSFDAEIQEFVPFLNSKNPAFKNKFYLREGTLSLGIVLGHRGDPFLHL